MTSMELFAGGLTAAAADAPEPRVIEGRIVPYGEPGRTSLGLKTIRRGALRLVAEAPIVGLYGHNREQSASLLIAHDDRADGLHGRLRVPETPTGDLLLAEVRGGVRNGLSVELSDLQFDPADPNTVISARLDAVAHVPLPAYDSARVTALAATQHPPTGDPSVTAPAPTVEPVAAPAAPAAAPAAPAFDYAQLAAALAPHMTAAAAPAGLPTGGLSAVPGLAPSAGARPDSEDPVTRAASLQAAICRGEGTPELRAALNDITNTGLSIFQSPPGSLGEKLWEGASYQRRFVGLMRQKPLTSWKFTGWRWINRPALADYAGDKAAVPSNTVSVDQVEGTASRLAGAWDIDRKFVDFGDTEFWTELYTATAESYLEQSDARAASALISYAIDITADPATWPTLSDGATPAYALPAGYTTGTGGLVVTQSGVLQAAALLTAILEDTPRVRMRPDYVIMNTEDWLSLVNLTNLDLPAFLSLLGVQPGGFERHPEVPKGHVIAGVRNGATFRELGATPIRVQAQNIAQGGVDEGCFGYTGISMDKPGAIISVPITEPA